MHPNHNEIIFRFKFGWTIERIRESLELETQHEVKEAISKYLKPEPIKEEEVFYLIAISDM